MSVLRGKKIILGVSGGIAAYKTAHLVRLFIKAGAHVQVIMTPAAKEFVTPLTLSTLSKRPVYSQLFDENAVDAVWNNHVELALWADLMLIAPATAHTLSKMAAGTSDNLLLATYLSAKSKVYFAPAMDLDMYLHPTTSQNFQKLQSFGNIMIPAEKGELASGLSGQGRMAEPENILKFIEQDLMNDLPLYGKKMLVTAGPTYEAIDPVRFIGNRSSGKMGIDIADEAANKGAEVILVCGPTHLRPKNERVELIRVESALEMYDACLQNFDSVDVVVAAAAVADYRPKEVHQQKIKKKEEELQIELVKNPDILASLGAKKQHQFLVGFALETQDEIHHATQKLLRKNLDLMVLNSLNDEGAGFEKPTNKVTFITKQQEVFPQPLKSKELVAKDIIQQIIKHYA